MDSLKWITVELTNEEYASIWTPPTIDGKPMHISEAIRAEMGLTPRRPSLAKVP